MTENDINLLKSFSKHDKVVAIGEIGLDYYYDNSPKRFTKNGLFDKYSWQMSVICLLSFILEMVIYLRYFKKYNQSSKVLIHCFSQSLEMAKKYIDMGKYIALGGAIT